eukprot:SAG31_NODE_23064_length_512_cov_0.755448_1_plen_125_part_10
MQGRRSAEVGLAAANLTAREMQQRISMLEGELSRSAAKDKQQAELLVGAERSFNAMCDDLRAQFATDVTHPELTKEIAEYNLALEELDELQAASDRAITKARADLDKNDAWLSELRTRRPVFSED